MVVLIGLRSGRGGKLVVLVVLAVSCLVSGRNIGLTGAALSCVRGVVDGLAPAG